MTKTKRIVRKTNKISRTKDEILKKKIRFTKEECVIVKIFMKYAKEVIFTLNKKMEKEISSIIDINEIAKKKADLDGMKKLLGEIDEMMDNPNMIFEKETDGTLFILFSMMKMDSLKGEKKEIVMSVLNKLGREMDKTITEADIKAVKKGKK